MIERVDAPPQPALGHRSLVLDSADHPHLAYCDDFLYYAWYDGTFWQKETVDDTTRVGRDCALALDAAGRPHISYIDKEAQALKYARYDGIAWYITTVDREHGEDRGFYYTSLALDTVGRPHLSYSGGGRYRDLKYAHFDGSAWLTATVDSTGSGRVGDWNSLLLDTSGRPHISYFSHTAMTDSLRYAHFDGSVWTTTTIDSGQRVGMYSALALDPDGWPHISYCAGGLRYAYYDGAAWIIEVVDSLPVESADTSLALDRAGQPHISYTDLTYSRSHYLKYAHHDGGAWQVEMVGLGSIFGTSLAVDGTGRPHIAYIDVSTAELRYAFSDQSCWHIVAVDQIETVGEFVSLALDSAGRPHLAYCTVDIDTRFCTDLKYAHYDGAAWQIATVDGTGWGSFVSLALDAADRPHIVYQRQTLRYAWYDGTAWTITTASPGGWYPSLQLDSAGQPRFSYYNYTSHDLKYVYFDGQSWQSEPVDTVGVQAGVTSLALDGADRPHIVYQGPQTLRYARYDGTTWLTTTVDSPGYMYRWAALALDAAGRPHISYYDQNNEALKYAYFDGQDWQVTTVDDNGTAGAGNSLALDAAGRPHISYYVDWPANELRYAYFDGSAWLTATVDQGYQLSEFGQSSSVAVDAAGRPHIGYADSSHGDVNYAHLIDCVPVTTVTITGPASLPAGTGGLYTAGYAPPTAPLRTLTWDNGALGSQAMYDWLLTGTHRLTATADYYCAATAGTFTVAIFCQPPTGAAIQGPGALVPGLTGSYAATALPITTSPPLTFTWDNGTVGATTAYSWSMPGTKTLTVTAINHCGIALASRQISVLVEWPYNLYLPVLYDDR
jgi:hypothetical protein